MFIIDGMEWDFPCDIKRIADMKASDISGLMLDRSYFNDVLGTFLQFEVKIVVPNGYEARYGVLYEKLTDPVSGHNFVFPYNGNIVNIIGRVESINDIYKEGNRGMVHWRGISFKVIANNPTKLYSLSEAISYGLSPMPDNPSPAEGTIYQWTANGWEMMGVLNPNEGDAYMYTNGAWIFVNDSDGRTY